MASKKGSKKGAGGFGIPLGSTLDLIDGVGAVLLNYFSKRYEVEKKMGELREDAKEGMEELKKEAIKTSYAAKKALLRSVVEVMLLTTALFSLIVGAILVLSETIPLKYVLLAYGIVMTSYLFFSVKTQPQ
jgi:preprotein translocase subunit SecE